MKYEYKIEIFEATLSFEFFGNYEKLLNNRGSEGWELLTVAGPTSYQILYWKRAIKKGDKK